MSALNELFEWTFSDDGFDRLTSEHVNISFYRNEQGIPVSFGATRQNTRRAVDYIKAALSAREFLIRVIPGAFAE
jgi:hypothetical protein